MSWFYKLSQSKPMPLPFNRPQDLSYRGYDKSPHGYDSIDRLITDETSNKLKRKYNPKYLGSGTVGVVLDLGRGHVAKLTDDYSEYKIAEWFMKNPHPRIVPVYNVEYIQKQMTDPVSSVRIEPIWMIEMHKAILLKQYQKTLADNWTEWSKLAGGHIQPNDPQIKISYDYWLTRYPDSKDLIDELLSFSQDLNSSGISVDDARGDNVGFINNKLVLIDLGATSTT